MIVDDASTTATANVPPATAALRDRPLRSCADSRRAFVATVVSVAVPFIVDSVLRLVAPAVEAGADTTVMLFLLGWNLFVVVYVVLTIITFSRRDSATFRQQMAIRMARRTWFWTTVVPGGDGPALAVEAAVVAFAVVLVLPHVPYVSIDDWVVVPMTTTILFGCWLLAAVSYALHYAQTDLAQPGLEFPGTRTGAFDDYLYFSIAVATTFGATDVNITTPQMRRVVNIHTILTFLYNTVIVALLVSLLTR